MRALTLTLNGERVEGAVEPRTHLADFLREQQLLTGTHLGCEHGVCGACTVLIDGAPARSCITYAVACDGAHVTTIEGLDDDPVAERLRAAFREHHGLQCGYCTPGMMITCRDIVLRLPDADEARIREELSGNLCRCTGYQGIVAAVQSVAAARRQGDTREVAAPARRLGPVGAGHAATPQAAREAGEAAAPARDEAMPAAPAAGREVLSAEDWAAVERQGVEIARSFTVAHPRAEVWEVFADPGALAACMPGGRITSTGADGTIEGEVAIRLGPIAAAFGGAGVVERDEASFRGTVRGVGRDRRSASRVRGIVAYALEAAGERETHVDVRVVYLLAGPLAQFSRGGIVQDVANRLTSTFASNLEARLAGEAPAAAAASLNAGALALQAIRDRLRALLRRLFGRTGPG